MPKTPEPPQPPPEEEPLDPATEEALAWLVHLHSGEANEGDRQDYETWRDADPAHAEAAARAERLWQMLGPALAGRRAKGKTPKRLPLIVLAVLGAGALAFAGGLFGPPAAFFADERTGVGERRAVALADGSRVELDTGTSLDVAEGGRRLTLYAGQIFVTVARDPARPFVVESGKGRIEALGTAFDVRRDGAATTVDVVESKVRVTYPDAGGGRSAVVGAGQEVAFAPATGLGTPQTADLATGTAWRRGQLRFAERPLGDVLAELGRYRRGAVVFTDAASRRLPVTGVFDLDRPEALLDALEVALPVKVRRLPWLTIVGRR